MGFGPLLAGDTREITGPEELIRPAALLKRGLGGPRRGVSLRGHPQLSSQAEDL